MVRPKRFQRCLVEALEPRRLFAGVGGVGGVEGVGVALEGGTLVVTGTAGNDVIRVSSAEGKLLVSAGGVDVGVFGSATSVRLEGGAGDDTLIVSPGVGVPAVLMGGEGEDTLVAGGTAATLMGGAGVDAMWAGAKSRVVVSDAEGVEVGRGVNRLPAVFSTAQVKAEKSAKKVGSFIDDIGKTIRKVAGDVSDAVSRAVSDVSDAVSAEVRGSLKEPGLTTLAWSRTDFTGLPLFGVGGPGEDDISQGRLNDCYVMAALASVARTDPTLIRQMITDLGDGTFAVKLMKGKTATYYRVDADLPITIGTKDQLAYAQLGQGNSLWVALVEKALAMSQGGSYKGLDKGGWMSTVYKALGIASTTAVVASGPFGILGFLATNLIAGKMATLATKVKLGGTIPMVANHAYTVDSVVVDETGRPVAVRLRNPWTFDGPGGDGYVEVAAKLVVAALSGVVVAG